jgi:hypothetical protein
MVETSNFVQSTLSNAESFSPSCDRDSLDAMFFDKRDIIEMFLKKDSSDMTLIYI